MPRDVAIPAPPLDLASRVCSLERRADPLEVYDRAGAEHKQALLGLLPDDWSFEGKRVLDFGCGAGRTLRQFVAEAETAEFWGTDIDRPSIEWMQDALCPPLNVVTAPEAPPLDFESGSFDLVWALSVFTHLVETSLPWLRELHRLLKPDGLLVASYMGRWNAHLHGFPGGWDEDLVGMNVLEQDKDWALGGPSVFMSDWWIREHWGRAFEILETVPVQAQTWTLMRKRELAVTVHDLEQLSDDPREMRAIRHNLQQVVLGERFARRAIQHQYEQSASWRLTRPLRETAKRLRSARARLRASRRFERD